jgi:hypothetical protein
MSTAIANPGVKTANAEPPPAYEQLVVGR